MGQARRGMLTRFQPLVDVSLSGAGCGQMVGQQLGLALGQVDEILLQHRRDPGMQFLPPRAQQRAIGGILHEGVLEQVGGVGRHTAAEQQPGFGEPIET